MAKFIAAAKRFVREEEGATLVEYALAIALISLVAGAGAFILGSGISYFLRQCRYRGQCHYCSRS